MCDLPILFGIMLATLGGGLWLSWQSEAPKKNRPKDG